MAKKKTDKPQTKTAKVNELLAPYETNRVQIFNSFEEQANYELQEMAKPSSEQILQQLRKFINTAYSMCGYDPHNLPEKHTIKIVKREQREIQALKNQNKC